MRGGHDSLPRLYPQYLTPNLPVTSAPPLLPSDNSHPGNQQFTALQLWLLYA